MNLRKPNSTQHGSVLVAALITAVILMALAAVALKAVVPRYTHTYQVNAWQEARQGAEAGLDLAISELRGNFPDATSGTNWGNGSTIQWRMLTGTNPITTTGTFMQYSSSLPYAGGTSGRVQLSGTLLLDNFDILASGTGRPTKVDVQVQALYPVAGSGTADPGVKWFRIRSMAMTAIPQTRGLTDSMDTSFRRLSFQNIRDSIWQEDSGTKQFSATQQLSGTSYASRVVEALIRPLTTGDFAILTGTKGADIGQSNGWLVDSWNSNATLSYAAAVAASTRTAPNGTTYVNKNGDVGSMKDSTGSVTGGGDSKVDIMGDVNTAPGGTVSGFTASGEISSTLDATLVSYDDSGFVGSVLPSVTSTKSNGKKSVTYSGTAGSTSNPAMFTFSGDLDLSKLTVSAPSGGGSGAIQIRVTGGLTLGGSFSLPDNVKLTLYVDGNIDFGSGNDTVNVPDSTHTAAKAGNLYIYGCGDTGTVNAGGTQDIYAVIIAPTYDATYSGNVNQYGSLVANSYSINGGGGKNGGFHYDEALGGTGLVVGYKFASCLEDTRK